MSGRKKRNRHPQKALSAAFVRSAPPGKHFDGNGLILKVDSTGSRRWVQRILIRGKRTELGLGSAKLVGLAEARELASSNRKLARNGGDPLRAKKDAEGIPTFEESARIVYELHRPSWRNAKHAAQFISTLETYVFPRMGAIKISDVTTADVLAVLSPIWLSKAETARRVRQRIGVTMKWSVAQGWRLDNPAESISEVLPRQNRSQTPRKSLPYREVGACIKAVRASGALNSTKLTLELLVLTACRSCEVRNAMWNEVDLDNAEWTIPPSRMKTKRVHRIPLSPRCVQILEEALSSRENNDLIFPGIASHRPISGATLKKLITGLGYDVDVHGFRTSFKVWCQEQTNFPREVSEAALAHTIGNRSEAAYARSDLFEKRRRLMELWGSFLSAHSAEIVQFRAEN